MQIRIHDDEDTPIYQQIVDCVSRDILSGSLSPGFKLPTVRDLADSTGVSRGTVKHAYDQLEHLGLIEMTQGRGTFVCPQQNTGSTSKKDLAMQAIDDMLDDMLSLSFSLRDIRIFFDLKMREREELYPHVRIGAIDCTPEALAAISNQLSTFPNAEVYQFLLSEVLEHPEKLNRNLDLIVASSTHFGDLKYKVPDTIPLMRMVLSVSSSTVLQLARLTPGQRVGIVAASSKYAGIIVRSCKQFSLPDCEPSIFILGSDKKMEAFLTGHDILIAPTNYYKYCARHEEEALARWTSTGKQLICYEYHIDSGSFFYIGEEIEQIYTSRRNMSLD